MKWNNGTGIVDLLLAAGYRAVGAFKATIP
jgi:hypothetical protein